MTQLLTMDIGGTSTKYGVWQHNQLMNLKTIPTPTSLDELLEETKIIMKDDSLETLEGLALSCPGVVDSVSGFIHGRSAVPFIHGFNFKEKLTEALSIPVSIQNDANCAALSEIWLGNAQDSQQTCFLIIGTGVGGAIVENKKLKTGNNLFGGEFGYQIIKTNPITRLSDCGSPVKMARNFTEVLNDGQTYDGKQVFEMSKKGHPLAIELINNLYDSLAIGIYNLLVSINPELILLGGAISSSEDLIPELKTRVDNLLDSFGATEINYQLQKCRYQNDSNLIGAVYQFMIDYGI